MREHKKLFVFILIVSGVRLVLLPLFNLVPQEAYYWLYIQNPALGYFDHPPMCANTIGLFTLIFGKSEFGVRFGMVLYSIGTMLMVYFLALDIFQKRKYAFSAVVLLNLSVFFNITSIIATPDTPLLFFWSLTIFSLYRAVFVVKNKFSFYWILAGISAGLALQSKYTAGFLFICAFCFFLFSKRFRFYLFTPWPYLSVITAFIVFFPVIHWNMENDWASFAFQSSRRAGEMTKIKMTYFFQLIFSQLYELTPLLFFPFFPLGIRMFKDFYYGRSQRRSFLFLFSVPIIVFFVVVSFTSLVKMNWLQPAFVTLIIAFAHHYHNNLDTRKFRFLRNISLFLIGLNLFMIIVPLVPLKKGDTWNGWRELGKEVTLLYDEMAKSNRVFIFGNKYKVAAETAFYTDFEEKTYAQNIYGKPALQFDFRKSPGELAGQDAIFIFSDFQKMSKIKILNRYFSKVEFHKELKIQYYQETPLLNKIYANIVFRRFYIYKCYDYQPLN